MLTMAELQLMSLYKHLSEHFGNDTWWIAETPFEVMVGALLIQQTTWKNVENSIANLKDAELLSIESLALADITAIEDCIRPSGFYRQKAGRLKALARYLLEGYSGDLNEFFARDTHIIRKELLSLAGIGQETADSILLYADKKLKFVIDAYTFRTFKHLGLDFEGHYKKAQEYFEAQLPKNLEIYRHYHALIVKVGKHYCKVSPLCSECPLKVCCQYYTDLNGK